MDAMAIAMFSQAAWRRSLLSGVDTASTDLPREWPGNVRQLRQVVATALVRSMSCDITADDLPAGYARGGHLTALERAERQALTTALREANGDREAAARDLGISRATIYRKLKRLKVTVPPGHGGPTAKRSAR